MEFTEISRNVNSDDMAMAIASKQWFHSGSGLTVSKEEAEKYNRVFYLTKIIGSGITISVNDSSGAPKTVAAGVGNNDFVNPLLLGTYGFSITGTVTSLIGFYV